MDAHPTLPLLDRLRVCAALWSEATDAKLARLGREVVNDGGFFARLESPGASTTTATLEKFARFLIDPANWPDAKVPGDVVAFGHVTGIGHRPDGSSGATRGEDSDTLRLPALSRGTSGEVSTREVAR